MAVHGAFKNKNTAEDFAAKMRKKGYASTTYKKKSTHKWYVSVTRK